MRKGQAVQGQLRTPRRNWHHTFLRKQFPSSAMSEWLQDHSFQGTILLLILALSCWLIWLEPTVKTLPFNKKIPIVHSRETQRINCHVRLHFLHSYTGLIFRLQPYFWCKQSARIPLSFLNDKVWACTLTSGGPQIYLSYTWELRQVIKMEEPSCAGACSWSSEIQQVEDRPWQYRHQFGCRAGNGLPRWTVISRLVQEWPGYS